MCVVDVLVITAALAASLACGVEAQLCGGRSRGARLLVFPEGSTLGVRVQSVKKLQMEKPFENQPLWQQVMEVEELFSLPNHHSFTSLQRLKRPSDSSHHQTRQKGRCNATSYSNQIKWHPWSGKTGNSSGWRNSANQWPRAPEPMVATRPPEGGEPEQKPTETVRYEMNDSIEEPHGVQQPVTHPWGQWSPWFSGYYYNEHKIKPSFGEESFETETATEEIVSGGKMETVDHTESSYMYGQAAYAPTAGHYQRDTTPMDKWTHVSGGTSGDYRQLDRGYDVGVRNKGKHSVPATADDPSGTAHRGQEHHGTYFPSEDYGTSCYSEPYYHHRRQRRQLYSVLENMIDAHGLDGRACILRAICEARKLPESTAGSNSLVADVLRLVFTIPSGQRPNMRQYESTGDTSCWSAACPFSLLAPTVAALPSL